MTDDRDEELERIEKELLADDDLLADMPASILRGSDDDDIAAIFADDSIAAVFENDGLEDELYEAPAFEDPDQIHEPEEPMVYCNFSNDYGKSAEHISETRQEPVKVRKSGVKKEDNLIVILMAVASFLCLGIIGVMIYWLEVFLT